MNTEINENVAEIFACGTAAHWKWKQKADKKEQKQNQEQKKKISDHGWGKLLIVGFFSFRHNAINY